MQSLTIRPALAVAALSTMVVIAGCQSYDPSPLDAAAHREAWQARTPADESVTAFAERLNKASPDKTVAYDPEDGIELAEGEMIALVYNPDLRLARLKAGVALATADHAGLWDDPQLGVDLLRITESVSDPWIVTAGLAITLPISGRLEAEKSRADAAYQVQLLKVAEAEWKVRHEVRLTWLEWSAAKVKLQQQEQLIESIGTLVDATKKLADAGELPTTEAGLFEIERVQRRYELRRLQGKVATAEQHLRALMGLSPKAPLKLNPQVISVATSDDDTKKTTVDNNPALARLSQEYEVAEQTLRREARKQYPDLTIGPVVESDEGQSRIGLSGGIPLPILNANKQGIAEAKAERELARAAYETEYERLVGLLAQTQAKAKALTGERELVAGEMAPLVDQQVARARKLLDLGEGGGLVLLESLVRAHETKLHLIDVRLDEAKAYAELTYLAGPATSTTQNKTQQDPPSAKPVEEVSP
ncbi:MAG: TolC family protein [Planctomycetota bacterium]